MAAQERRASPVPLTDSDRVLALLAYVICIIVPLVILLSEGAKSPFQRYHALQSLGLTAAWLILYAALFFFYICITIATLGLGGFLGICFLPLTLFTLGLQIYYALLAYRGEYFSIPVVTRFMKAQGLV